LRVSSGVEKARILWYHIHKDRMQLKKKERDMKHQIADAHVHLEDAAEGNFQRPGKMLDIIGSKGVTDLSLLAYMPFSDVISNLRVLFWKKAYRKISIRAFGSFHESDLYKDVPYEKQYEKLMDLGCDGIKFIQMKPDRRKVLGKGLNDPSYDKAFDAMERDGTPVTIHSGDPESFWDRDSVEPWMIERGWYYGDGTYPSCEELYAEDFEMLDKHPRLNVTFAHFFFLSNKMEEAKRVMERYPNVRFDLTPGWEMYLGFSKKIDAWQRFFEEYSDRILFGTDSNDEKKYIESLYDLVYTALTHDKSEYEMPIWKHTVRGLDLKEDTVRKICIDNYIRFVGKTPKPVNEKLLIETGEKMLSDIKGDEKSAVCGKWIEEMLLAR